MKIAIYDPYLDTVGGGEKYMMSIAEALIPDNRVDILLDPHLASMNIDEIKNKIESRLGLDLAKVNFCKGPVGEGSNFFSRYFFLKGYDWFFYITDGSIFLAGARNNVLHFQMPFDNTQALNWWGKLKLGSWREAIYNSEFTRDYVEKRWEIRGRVIYPPVSTQFFKPLPKKKQIVSVGRFFGFTKVKKHELMVDVFKDLALQRDMEGWSLHLAGGLGEGNEEYLEQLKKRAAGGKIFFYPNISLEDLAKLYGKSAVYWHAMGFKEEDPKRFEHFGITTVEAMAAGCVPVVINLGGQKEIVENGISGFLWDNIEELKVLTMRLVNDKKLMTKLSEEARVKALRFTKEEFTRQIRRLVYED